MSEIFNESVLIDGVADEVQLTVQGVSGQTEALQSWEDSAANQKARITADGRFQNGDMSVSTPDALIEAHRDSSSSLPKRGFHSLGRIASALSDAVSWLVAELELVGTGTITGLHRVIRAKLTHSSTGDSSTAEVRAGDLEIINQGGTSLDPLGKAVGLQVSIDNQASAHLVDANGISSLIKNATGANIETAKAFEVPAVVNNGTIDTLIGLDIADMNEGSDNYAIRTGAGKVQFGDLNIGLVKADNNGLLSNAVKGIDFDTPMQGASSSANGVSGDVPQPQIGDEEKFLRGDGTWAEPEVVTNLNSLTDVDTTGAQEEDYLAFNGTAWVPQSPNFPELMPPGVVMPFVGSSAPDGWLLADGHAVEKAVYDALFDLIGYGYKRLANFVTRTSDNSGEIDFAFSGHGLGTDDDTLTLRFELAPADISAVATSTDIITTSADHHFDTEDRVQVSSTGTLPGGLAANTDYYVRKLSSTTLTLHTTAAAATADTNKVNLTSAGSGTRTLTPQDSAAYMSGMVIGTVTGSVLSLSGGTEGHSLPAAGTVLTVECEEDYFFLPDMAGRVPVGKGQGFGLSNRILGTDFGEENHQLTISEMPSHNHNITAYGFGGSTDGVKKEMDGTSASTFSTANRGLDQAHNNMQPSLVLSYIIKA